jgi:hypothetical protein
MVRYWLRTRDTGWRRKLAINAVGATATGLVTVIVVYTKFAEGAWLVTVAIPLLVLAFLGINRHYRRFARRLRVGVAAVEAAGTPSNQVLLEVDGIDPATSTAYWYGREITAGGGTIRALHAPGRHTDSGLRARWFDLADGTRLEVLPTDEGRMQALLEEVWRLPRGECDFVTMIVPEQFRRPSLLSAAGSTSFRLKVRLLSEPGVVVTDVPAVAADGPAAWTPKRIVVRILVANVHAASLRAVNYAATLGVEDTRAVSFAFDAEEAAATRAAWLKAGVPCPLDLSDAPYRDVGTPLLGYIRELTEDPDTLVNVVMPEIVVRGWARLLHNQRALYIKRLLLFEPHVALSSVPYQVFR